MKEESAKSLKLRGWMRGLAIFVGICALALGIVIVVWPNIGLGLLVIFLAIGLILMGIERLCIGISGRSY